MKRSVRETGPGLDAGRRGHDFWLQGAQPGTANGPHSIGQCGRCSRKSANAADGDLAAVGFRNSVRAEIHADLQGDRVWVGFGAAATPAPAGDIRSRSRSRSNGYARWSCCHTWLSRKSRRHDPARAVPSTRAEQPEPARRTRRGHLLAMRAPPHDRCARWFASTCRARSSSVSSALLVRWASSRRQAVSVSWATCSSFGFGDSCRCRSTWPRERRQRLERSSRSASA